MEKKKLFRDRQEVGPDDFDEMQNGIRDSFDHIVADGITIERRYVGFQVAKENATAIRVGVGRVYQTGKVYTAETESVLSVTSYLPVVNRKLLAVYAYGSESDTDVQERNFVSDVSVYPPVGIPQAVPITRIRAANVGVSVGTESVDPQMPVLPDTAVLLATVVLTTTGVLDGGITRAVANILPNLQSHHTRLGDLDVWRTQTGAKVDTLTSEQASLFARTTGKADLSELFGIMSDLAKVKKILELPTAGAPYDTDNFRTSAKIDQTASPVDTNYRLNATFPGALFPNAGFANAPIALFNPYESNVYRSGTDLVLPKFEPVLAVEVPGYSGELNISQYSATVTVTKQMTGYTTETRYA